MQQNICALMVLNQQELLSGMVLFMMKMESTQMNYKPIKNKEKVLKVSLKHLPILKMNKQFTKNVIFSFQLHLNKQLTEYNFKIIQQNNAAKFNCRVIAEAANGPTTLAAEEILIKKGVKFLPDILLNAGGVTVSYFEWL